MSVEKIKINNLLFFSLISFLIQSCAVHRGYQPPTTSKGHARISVAPSSKVHQLKKKVSAPRPGDSSLIATITHKTAPRQAVSLRFTEEGKTLIQSGQFSRAVVRLEKSLALDSASPYTYFYLGRAHYYLGQHQKSLNFLEVAESLFNRRASWLGEIYVLKGEIYQTLGSIRRARLSFSKALRMDPENPAAAEKLNLIRESKAKPVRR